MAEVFFDEHPSILAIFHAVENVAVGFGPVTVRTSRSQVAFARRRGFANLRPPDRWLRNPAVETVLSIALVRHDPSVRFKDVVHPSRRVWMRHLEVHDGAEIDAVVAGYARPAKGGLTGARIRREQPADTGTRAA